jgi:hypothetical protein
MVWIVNYWKYALVFLSLSVLSTSLMWMKISNIKLEADNKVLESELSSITLQLEQNAKDYETAMNEYTENMKHRDTVFKTKTEKIYIWEDENASCEDVINRFNNYTF